MVKPPGSPGSTRRSAATNLRGAATTEGLPPVQQNSWLVRAAGEYEAKRGDRFSRFARTAGEHEAERGPPPQQNSRFASAVADHEASRDRDGPGRFDERGGPERFDRGGPGRGGR